jgi:hypothetical protein
MSNENLPEPPTDKRGALVIGAVCGLMMVLLMIFNSNC